MHCVGFSHLLVFQAELKQEQLGQAKEIASGMQIISDISTDINQNVQADQEGLDQISEDVENSKTSIDTGNNHLVKV